MALEDTIVDVIMWQRETFPSATRQSTAMHLFREADELLHDIFNGKNKEAAKELADVFFLAIAVSDHLDLNIEKIIRDKFEINKRREWGEPDKDGVVEHVRAENGNLNMPDWEIRMRLTGELPG